MTQLRRSIRLEGAPNFRDLGGYTTADGRRVRCGLVYRSQAFLEVTSEDLATIGLLGIQLVCDLRSHGERQHAPNRWPDGHCPTVLHLDVNTDARAGRIDFLNALRASPGARGARNGMIANYRNMPRAFAAALPALFEHLLDASHLPAMIHCHAGKDRTGFLSAMLLLALGVPLDTVYEDYLRTAELIDTDKLAASTRGVFSRVVRAALSREAMRQILSVERVYLEAALEAVEDGYGSIDAYLETVGGLDTVRRERLQAIFLAPATD